MKWHVKIISLLLDSVSCNRDVIMVENIAFS